MRADKFEVVEITNMKRPNGTQIIEPGKSRLTKVVERYTMTCPECGSDGRVDENGDTVCEDDACAVMLSGENEPMMYPEDDFSSTDSNGSNVSASGHPLMRTPALNPAGPAGDE